MAVEELNTIEEQEQEKPKQTTAKKKTTAKKAAVKEAPAKEAYTNERRVSVYVPVDPTIKDNHKIVSVNGKFYTIMRGVWVDNVPLAVAEVLQNAERATQVAAAYIAQRERQ